MIIEADLQPSDHRAFQRFALFRLRKVHWIYSIMLLLMMALTWNGIPAGTPLLEKVLTLVGLGIVFITVFAAMLLLMVLVRRFSRGSFQPIQGRHVFEISEAGITEQNPVSRTEWKWDAIQRTTETREHFFIIARPGLGMILPKRAPFDQVELRRLMASHHVRR